MQKNGVGLDEHDAKFEFGFGGIKAKPNSMLRAAQSTKRQPPVSRVFVRSAVSSAGADRPLSAPQTGVESLIRTVELQGPPRVYWTTCRHAVGQFGTDG
jgi:hypothetical protein